MARLGTALADRYRIERELGAGGMATVYLAHDLKHDRKVAIKVLKPELAAVLGAERFVVEIKTTASLQHPHILPLFDSGAADGFLFYVMPYIEGETLRTKLDRETQFGVDEAVRIARDVADTLDYAHRHGVIHRDIKPENILLHDGRPMVADFGIALAVSAAAGGRMTETGLSLGTPHYMSPEQATAEKEITARSDVYSLGSVLYEMLAGQPPHLAGSAQQIIMKIITEPAPLVTQLRKSVPANVAAAVATSLEKLPADRFESAKAFAEALVNPAYARGGAIAVPPAVARGRRLRTTAAFVALSLIVVASSAGWWTAAHRGSGAALIRLTLENPPGARIVVAIDALAISPDGRTIAFVARFPDGKTKLYLRALDDVAPRALAGTEKAIAPFFSPDGRWVGFVAERQLKKVPIGGGSVVTLAEVNVVSGASWGTSGVIAVADGSRLTLVPENGGTSVPAPGADTASGRGVRYPVFLADGETVLYTNWSGSRTGAKLMARSIKTGAAAPLGVDAVSALGVVDGTLIYSSGTLLFAVPFDARAHRAMGQPQQIMDRVAADDGVAAAALSLNGALVYQAGSTLLEAVVSDLQGKTRLLTADQKLFQDPRISPDGKRAAVDIEGRTSIDIWLFDLAAGSSMRLTASGTANTRPEWTSDGKRVIYRSNRDGTSSIWSQPVDGSGPAEILQRSPGRDAWEGMVSPDGQYLLYRTGTTGSSDIWYRRLTGDTATKPFAVTAATEMEGRFSPDGKWVAYSSDEPGERQVFVRPFPSGGSRYQVSYDLGVQPVWSRDMRRLYYVSRNGQLVSARIVTTPAFAVVGRDTVVRGGYYLPDNNGHAIYDVAPDGTHLLLLRPVATEVPTIVVLGWFDDVRERMRQATRK